METTALKEKDIYKTSRLAYIFEAAFEYFIAITSMGAYLAKLTTSLGISDSMTAILTALTSLACSFQIISIFLTHKTPVKRWVIPSQIFANLLFAALFLIPFLNVSVNTAIIFFVVILTARALKNISQPAKTNWFISLIEDRRRGQFQAILNIISLIGGIGFSFLISRVIDSFDKKGNLKGAFLFITITILVLTMLHTLSLLLAKEKEIPIDKSESHLKSLKNLIANRKYRLVLILYIIWTVASNVTAPFLGTYQINDLGFSLTLVATFDIVMSLLNIPLLYFFGRCSIRKSYSSIMRLSYLFAIAAYICLAFSTKSNGIVVYTLYRIINLLTASSQAVSSTNLVFDVVPANERTAAFALNSAVLGLIGFLTTLAVSPLVDYIQTNGNTFLGFNIFAQQLLAIISAFIIVILVIYYYTYCKRVLEE